MKSSTEGDKLEITTTTRKQLSKLAGSRLPTLSWRLVVARVEGGGEGRGGVRDVAVEMAASTAVRQHSHAQHQYNAQQQRSHQACVDSDAAARS